MLYQILANVVLFTHLAFIVFAALGALLVLYRPRIMYLHLPVVFWAATVEFCGWICPLTPLENFFRRKAGLLGYSGDFIGHYLTWLIYPEGLTRGIQIFLGVIVLTLNAVLYSMVWIKRQKEQSRCVTP